MGQTIFAPPNVAGWTGDQSSADWLNTSTWISRANVANGLLYGAGGKNSAAVADATLQQVITSHNLHTPDDAVNYYVGLLLDGHLADDRKAALKTAMTASGGQTVTPNSLRTLLYLIMASPEYQLN
jgi:hypothetical protein